MKRRFFIAAAASAISVIRPGFARAVDQTNGARLGTNVEATAWRKPMVHCGSAVVWLNTAIGIYYYKGDRSYGRTKRGAYTCEREAIDAGHRASAELLR